MPGALSQQTVSSSLPITYRQAARQLAAPSHSNELRPNVKGAKHPLLPRHLVRGAAEGNRTVWTRFLTPWVSPWQRPFQWKWGGHVHAAKYSFKSFAEASETLAWALTGSTGKPVSWKTNCAWSSFLTGNWMFLLLILEKSTVLY